MSFAYTGFKESLLKAGIDFATQDFRVALVMTNTTADTDQDALTIGGITLLDEFDGAGYVSGGLALAGEAVTRDDPNNRSEFDASDLTFPALGAGTRQIQGAILYKFITSFSLSLPIAFIDTGGFPISANGGDITIQWNLEGILQGT